MKHLSLLFFVMLMYRGVSAHESSRQLNSFGNNVLARADIASATLIVDYTLFKFTADGVPQLYVQFAIINNTGRDQAYLTTDNLFSKLYSVDNKDLVIPPDKESETGHSFVPKVVASHASINFGLTFKLRRQPGRTFSFKLGMKLVPCDAGGHQNYESMLREAKLSWSDEHKVTFKEGRVQFERLKGEQLKRDLEKPLTVYHALTTEEKNAYVLTVDSGKISFPVDTSMYNFLDKRKTKFLLCYVNLENHSNDTLKYVNMNCSYLDVFLVDNKDFSIPPIDNCYKNNPEIVEVPPHGARKIRIPLMVNRFGPVNKTFRIGMSLQKFVDNKQLRFDPEVYLLRPETANLIWSNEVHLP